MRTVEVNNPKHVDHIRRADVDEILVTSRLASRLLALSALYPGLTGLVTDIVSGGDGSELYRVELPEAYLGLSIDELATRLRSDTAPLCSRYYGVAMLTSIPTRAFGSSPATMPW